MFPFPPTLYFLNLLNEPEVVVYDEPFAKQSLHSRYYILNSQGEQRLSVPVKHPLVGKMLFEVEIDNQMPWQRNHWRSLEAAYRQSAYFVHFEQELAQLFHSPYTRLIDFTVDSLTFCLKCVKKSPAQIKNSLTTLSDRQNTEQMGIITSRKSMKHVLPPTFGYPTVFGKAFDYNTSVLDALFCAGPQHLLQAAQQWALIRYNSSETTV